MTIVVGYLATAEGQEALRIGVEEAVRRSVPLVVVISERAGHASEETEQTDREERLAAARAQLEGTGVEFSVRVVGGSTDVADDLVTTAEQTGAELLVIGLRRRSPVGKLILGSNAQRILLDASCPVLAVKPARA